ncbi:MAG: hypothetical protein KJP00_03020 [Bacteroidia bacterium]|nr:hypothetical protein [Bacteroidia bacterium]
MQLKFLFPIVAILIISNLSCTNDKLVEPITNCNNITPTYDADVKAIIDLSCAYSGCHVSGSSAPGNYSTYGGISRTLTNGLFEDRIFNIKDDPVLGMPPDNSPGPKDLSSGELELLRCWMENGYAEN